MAAERIQRRLAAILAADVVGYSRLMREDEAGTLARLKMLRKEVFDPHTADHNGRIVKTTGDGVLVEFASAVDATECAVKIQRALARRNEDVPEGHRIELRIGINLGDIIVDDDDIFGDGVNVAARLEGLCDPGQVYISAVVHDQVEGKIDAAFDDLGERTVKNIDKPIRVFRISPAAGSIAATAAGAVDRLFDRPAVAVLPFENIGGDPEQEYFADGLTEDIITALSLWKSFPVIARNSSFAFKGKSPDIRTVGKELGARYVIEGSTRKSGMRVRVTAQLINSESGHHIWTERYDRDLEDIFELQDEIAGRIAGIVAPELERAETKRQTDKQPVNFEAWDYCLRGRSRLTAFDGEENKRARELFERAIELDPEFSQAYAGIARSHYRDAFLGASKDRERSVAWGVEAARRAVALDPMDSYAHMLLAITLHHAGVYEPSISEAETAVKLNPSNAQAYFTLGFLLSGTGRPAEGIRVIDNGFRLNPYEPGNHVYFCMMAHAQFGARNYDDAIEWTHKAERLRPEAPEPHLLKAIALGWLERVDEARRELTAWGPPEPHMTMNGGLLCWQHDADQRHFLDGLRKAGWED